MRFEDLEIWNRSVILSAEIYTYFRRSRDFGFKDQITRSSLSVHSNIAEGFERKSRKEFANFLSYAKGSCGELRTQIYIGIKIEYISSEIGNQWIRESEEISRMIASLMAKKLQ
ncbi:four helix bundle protein [Shewanella ulleungensis]|uniref:Four helix bundle protein n=1 Tax=Shewanella ulleungensis TaxID=2282699 RepID=A0ABQ2QKB2_9GAMM|nr:four helix bundle protein [Shewanella ulleungensis]MCL1149856.1 four helix bundle protein [Shewanella ulleungensis]GGP85102.1 hypothetical protein GCM10009410_17830 [Shewanella ulleungensis]